MLGSSLTSSEIVRKAKQRGWYTIVTDNLTPENSPVKKEADAYWMISTAETDQLEEKCRTEGIDAIFAGVSEFNLDRVRTMTQNLGLPCYIEASAWEVARNKRAFKDKCKQKGVPVVQEYLIPAEDDEAAWAKIVYPVVVKPVDGTGNSGLSICANRKELEEGIRKARANSSNPELIIERYITGNETWNYYVIAEKTIRYAYSGRVFRQPGYPTFLYSFGTNVVDGIDDYLAEMNPQCVDLLEDIGCRDGMAWIQCIRDDKGNYYALEMAHRMSADSSGDLLEKCLGFNIVDWMLDTALGVRHTAEMLPQQMARPYIGAMCVYYMFAEHAGCIEKMTGFDQLDPELFQMTAIKKAGDNVGKYNVMVRFTFYVRDTEEMCQKLEYLNKVIDIRDTSGENLIIRYTDYETVRTAHQGLIQEQNGD